MGGKRAEMGSCNYCCFCALLVPLGSCSHEYIIHHNFGGTGAELGEEALEEEDAGWRGEKDWEDLVLTSGPRKHLKGLPEVLRCKGRVLASLCS